MEKLFQERGKKWNDIEQQAKRAVADALIKRSNEPSITGSVWLKSIAERIAVNLKESSR